jgi:hypothetical protein
LAFSLRTPVCVLALSPPRPSQPWFCSSPEGPPFHETYTLALRHVEACRPLALLDVRLPPPFVTTAGGYAGKYGPDERYNYLRFLADVRCPAAVAPGGAAVGNNMAYRQAPGALGKPAARGCARPSSQGPTISTAARGASGSAGCARRRFDSERGLH